MSTLVGHPIAKFFRYFIFLFRQVGSWVHIPRQTVKALWFTSAMATQGTAIFVFDSTEPFFVSVPTIISEKYFHVAECHRHFFPPVRETRSFHVFYVM